MTPPIVISTVFQTSENKKMFDLCEGWEFNDFAQPKLRIRKDGSHTIFRCWQAPENFGITILMDGKERRVTGRFTICMPGVAGYPYEGRLPHAEYPEAETWIVGNGFMSELFYMNAHFDIADNAAGKPEIQLTQHGGQVRFKSNLFHQDGRPMIVEEIIYFTQPRSTPTTSGMYLPAYAKLE